MHDSIASISPDYPFSLELLPKTAYMVGGAVRDALLCRDAKYVRDAKFRVSTRKYLDLDFVLACDAVKVARNIAKHYKAGFVLLDPQRQIARVVFPQATVDFAQQSGESIETDLHRRDFTVNAIAYNPHTQEIIDPLQGCVDLERRLLRMISPANLQDDPLRLMRAYRQAAQLNFTIETDTQTAIRSLASHITEVAAERVRVEINYLLFSSQGTPWITRAWEDNLLAPFFKFATSESFAKLTAVDDAAVKLGENWQQLSVKLQEYVRDTVKSTWLSIAKLACLVNPDPEVAEIELQKLTYSRAEIKGVTTALKLFPQLKLSQMSLREQYFFFQEVGFVFPATAVLALGHDILVEAIAPLIDRYLDPDDLVSHPTPLLSGKELILALQIPASPLLGKLLTEIAVAQVEGKISTPAEAIAFARQLLEG